MPNHIENEKLLRRYYQAMNDRDYDAVWTCFTDDVIYTDAALGHVFDGLPAFKSFYMEYMVALGVSMKLGSIVTTDTGYGITNHFYGKHTADLPGMPATGKSFSIPSASVGTFENDRIKTNTDYWNMHDLLKQLGVISG
ncbi:MAG: ester cyclase [Steroidobacteraceae bacterium]